MKSKNTITILNFMAIIIIIISGCTTITSSGIKRSDLYKGFDGVQISFMSGAPPKQVFADDYFQIGLELKNKGATNVTNGVFLISLDDELMQSFQWQFDNPDLFIPEGASQHKVAFNLEGKTYINPNGADNSGFLDIRAKKLDSKINDIDTSIYATICYDYKTELIENICVETTKFSRKNIKASCTAKTLNLGTGQGGPIAVTKVEIETLSDGPDYIRPQFTIYIENRGNGRAYGTQKVQEACSPQAIGIGDINTIKVDKVSFSGYEKSYGDIKCNLQEDTIKLKDQDIVEKKNFFRCTLEKGLLRTDTTNYETPLTVVLSYGYTTTISQPIKIQTPPN